jgi:multiple sugar transport system permease protein
MYRIVITAVIVVFTLIFIGPLYFLFSGGLKSAQEAIQTPPTIIPQHLHLSTYSAAWSRVGVGRLLVNTLYYAFGALAFQLVFDVAAAYSLSRLRPALIGSPEAIWLPSVANAFNIFLLKRFFDSIPRELTDAAAIDGASPVRVLRSIIIPISRPILGVVSIFALVGVWKDFLWPLLVEGGFNPTRETLNVGLWDATLTTPQNEILAASAMAAIPTIVFFLIFQRNILAGLTAGGVKA